MDTQKINGTLTQGKDMNLTLRLWLTQEQKDLFVLEKGRCPSIHNIIIMNKGDEE